MIERSAEGLRVVGPMLIANAKSLLDAGRGLLRPVKGTTALVLDFAAVEETDSSALGVVFGLVRAAAECGVTLRIANPPASMLSLASLYGVSESLPLV